MTPPAPRAASPIEALEPRLADGPDAGSGGASNASSAPDGGAVGAGNQSAWARVKDAVLGRAPDIEANIWIGPKSALWDAERAAQAEAMAQRGASPQEIWRETATFRGSDGSWRQETGLVPFSRAYPNARAHVRRELFDRGGGSYAPVGPFNLISGNEPRALTHELNHLASRIEGFAPGGNPILAGIEAKLRGEQFRGAYERLPGEIDAERAAQRYHLNDEQRVERFPGADRMRQAAGLARSVARRTLNAPDGGAVGAGNFAWTGDSFTLDSAGGQIRGRLWTNNTTGEQALKIDSSATQQPGTGQGVPLYVQAMQEAQRRGLPLVSDQRVSVSASHVYDALARRGYRVERNPTAEQVRNYWVSRDGDPVFRVTDAPSTGQRGSNGAALAALASLPPGALTLRELLRDHYGAA